MGLVCQLVLRKVENQQHLVVEGPYNELISLHSHNADIWMIDEYNALLSNHVLVKAHLGVKYADDCELSLLAHQY